MRWPKTNPNKMFAVTFCFCQCFFFYFPKCCSLYLISFMCNYYKAVKLHSVYVWLIWLNGSYSIWTDISGLKFRRDNYLPGECGERWWVSLGQSLILHPIVAAVCERVLGHTRGLAPVLGVSGRRLNLPTGNLVPVHCHLRGCVRFGIKGSDSLTSKTTPRVSPHLAQRL